MGIYQRIYVSRVCGIPTNCAGAVRDDLVVVILAVREGEVSGRATALVVRVEALVAIAFDFALDVIRC